MVRFSLQSEERGQETGSKNLPGFPTYVSNENQELHIYSIGHVMEKTGLTARQIRYYEEVELIHPERTAGNQRRFSNRDIDRLLRIKELLGENLTTEAIREVIEASEATPSHKDVGRPHPHQNPPELRGSARLTSLYPVSNNASLQRLLEERRKEN